MNKLTAKNLKGVPQTLLLPLIGRAMFSQKSYSPTHDEKAVELVSLIDYDFDNLLKDKNVKNSTLFWMARAYHFDKAIKYHLETHPEAVVVNLGCGLDTGFEAGLDTGLEAGCPADFPFFVDKLILLLLEDVLLL